MFFQRKTAWPRNCSNAAPDTLWINSQPPQPWNALASNRSIYYNNISTPAPPVINRIGNLRPLRLSRVRDAIDAPNIERNWIDFSQGMVKDTGNSLDVACQAADFSPPISTGPLYTRNGSCASHLRASSRQPVIRCTPIPPLATSSPTRRRNRQPVTKRWRRMQDGTFRHSHPSRLPQAGSAREASRALFRLTDLNLKPGTPTGVEVPQGRWKSSNASPPKAPYNLSACSDTEMLQSRRHGRAEMNKKAVEDVARLTA